MKKLEKKELKNVKGGILLCHVVHKHHTLCHFDDGVTSCWGMYTFSGETEYIHCHPSDNLTGC